MERIHTIVVSDLHLADAEPEHQDKPLWKKFRRKEYFIDREFEDFLLYICDNTKGDKVELVLNGDIFDFDSVCATPEKPWFDVSAREKAIGLWATEDKSTYKMNCILNDHQVWIKALIDFLNKGNSLVFIIGNHDIELYWPKVQQAILAKLNLSDEMKDQVRFCEWYYVSQQDTLIEHGHQYDPYCMCVDPIHPVVEKNGNYLIRLPFGNIANRNMINGMGLKNPHSEEAFVKSSLEFATFFYKYEMRVQPFMIFTWFFGAIRTLLTSLHEGHLPGLRDPLSLEERIKTMASKANSTTGVLLTLKDNHAHPIVHNPFSILRELWLDRAFLLIAIVWVCWQIFSTSNVFANVSLWWFIVPLFLAVPFFVYYAHGVSSDVSKNALKAIKHAPIAAKVCGVKRVIHGHTHKADHFSIDDVEYLNTGTWSPRFKDVECLQPLGLKHFAWISPEQDSGTRSAKLLDWRRNQAFLHENTTSSPKF